METSPKWLLAIVAVVIVLTASVDVVDALGPDFALGQIWSIKSPAPTTAQVIIGRIETWNDKVAVHVSVINIPAPSDAPPNRELIGINHVPFEKSALIASVDQLLGTRASPTPEFEQGYDSWRKDMRAGIFEIGVSQAIALMLEKIRRGRA
ncbi:hypothetical protein LJR220_002438 [Bradyrhizobium sp. LjRoot220]|uniref:hypothetical protein n=1 Tax=Bradyrhizobium sp. LjRoot220 TaxID=3342284 RepID=UPI003ED06949